MQKVMSNLNADDKHAEKNNDATFQGHSTEHEGNSNKRPEETNNFKFQNTTDNNFDEEITKHNKEVPCNEESNKISDATDEFRSQRIIDNHSDRDTPKHNLEDLSDEESKGRSITTDDFGFENKTNNHRVEASTPYTTESTLNNDSNKMSYATDDFGYRNKTDNISFRATNKQNREEYPNEEVDYDQLVTAAGEFGLYQTFLIFCTFPFYVFGVFAYFGQLFLTEASPNHWCWVPELENLTALERRTLAIPLDSNARFGYSQCEMFVANWTDVLGSGAKANQSWMTQPCRKGWEFNNTEIPYPSITSEMGWVCDKASYQATAQAIFFMGSVLGGFIFGWLSDRFGRIPAAVTSNLIGGVAGVAGVFSKDFLQFSISRFIVGVAYDYNMMMTYILVLEFVAPKYRSLMANLPFGIFYSLGATVLPWVAIGCGHWKTLGLVTSLPMLLAILTPLIVPESPKWLLIKGRTEKAIDQILTVARVNKKEIPAKLIEQFKSSARKIEPVEPKTLLDLIKRPVLRNNFICLCIEYMCCMTIFDALVRSLGSLQFDFFVSFTLVSLTECPSLVLISFILDLTGRKWLSVLCLSLCCVFSVLTTFIGAGLPSVLCAVAARFSVNMSTNIALQWGAEVLPTPVRGSAVSFIHICGFLASILSPYIVYLEKYVAWLPLVLVGLMALIGAGSALALPETVGRDMPQTFEDAELLNREQRKFDVPCLRRRANSYNGGRINPSFEMN